MELFAATLSRPILCLLVFACLPNRCANSHQKALRQIVTGIVGAEFLIALLFAVAHAAGVGAARSISLISSPLESSVSFGIYYDGATIPERVCQGVAVSIGVAAYG